MVNYTKEDLIKIYKRVLQTLKEKNIPIGNELASKLEIARKKLGLTNEEIQEQSNKEVQE